MTPLNAAFFRPALSQQFTLDDVDARPLTLVEVLELSGDSLREDGQPFSLLFHDPGATVNQAMPQATYALSHPTLGKNELFLVCLGPDLKHPDRPLVYEAVFG